MGLDLLKRLLKIEFCKEDKVNILIFLEAKMNLYTKKLLSLAA